MCKAMQPIWWLHSDHRCHPTSISATLGSSDKYFMTADLANMNLMFKNVISICVIVLTKIISLPSNNPRQFNSPESSHDCQGERVLHGRNMQLDLTAGFPST